MWRWGLFPFGWFDRIPGRGGTEILPVKSKWKALKRSYIRNTRPKRFGHGRKMRIIQVDVNPVLMFSAQQKKDQPKDEPAKNDQEGILPVAAFLQENKGFGMPQT